MKIARAVAEMLHCAQFMVKWRLMKEYGRAALRDGLILHGLALTGGHRRLPALIEQRENAVAEGRGHIVYAVPVKIGQLRAQSGCVHGVHLLK